MTANVYCAIALEKLYQLTIMMKMTNATITMMSRAMLIKRMMMQSEGGSVPMAKHPVSMSQSTLAHL